MDVENNGILVIRPLLFNNGQLAVNALFGTVIIESYYYGLSTSLIIAKHLKIDAGYVMYSSYDYSNGPLLCVGYSFNLYKKSKER